MKRLVVLCCAVAGAVGLSVAGPGAGGASAGAAAPVSASATQSWACVVIEHVNLGVCQGNPLPPSLPIDLPDVPV